MQINPTALSNFLMIVLSIFSSGICCQQTLTHPLKNQTVEQFFDSWAHNYKELVQKTQYITPYWLMIKKDILPSGKQLVLDLCCADGAIGELLQQYHPEYQFVGVDFSKNMVDACAQKKVYDQVIHTDLNFGLPEQLPAQHFDIVLATGCLEFIDNHEFLFTQINKILKPHGQLWVTLPAVSDKKLTDDNKILYMPNTAQLMFENHGFRILDFEIAAAGYVDSKSKEPVPYFLIAAQKK